jgi:hypothetical protein
MGNILKLSIDEQEKLADEYYEKKLDFEEELSLLLLLFFRKLNKDFKDTYSLNGSIISASDYISDLNAILTRSYDTTTEYFSNHFDRELKKQIVKTDDEKVSNRSALMLLILADNRGKVKAQIDAVIIPHIEKQSKIIMKTTQNILNEIVADTIDILDDELPAGQLPSNKKVADEAGTEIAKRNKNRVPTISETETGMGSGLGENTESQVLNDLLKDEELGSLEVTKTWISRLNDVVRETHLLAHGQERRFSKPFDVGDSLLMYPLDTSLGAQMREIINCYCISINT